MVDTNQIPPGTIPNEPPPAPPEQPSGTFVIPDIEPYQPAAAPPPPPKPVSAAPSMPFQQTVVVEDEPPQMPLPPQPQSPPMPAIPEVPPSMPSSTVPVSATQVPQVPPPAEPNAAFNAGVYPQENTQLPSVGFESGYVPPGLQDAPQPQINTPPPLPQNSGGLGKKILFILLFLLLLVGVAFGVRFGFQFLDSNKEVTLEYWGLWENESLIAPVIADFETKNPKIKIKYTQQNFRQYRERLQSAIDRGEGPDVFRFHATWVPMLKNEIQPVPSDVISPSQFSTQFYKVATQDLLAGSTLWGIPLEIDGLGLYINEDLFTQAGLTPPQTYEDLLSIVPKLTVKNGNTIVTSAIALGTTNNIDNFSDILSLMILQNGGKLTSPTGREAEEALVFYKKFASPSDPMYTWNNLLDNSISAFASGRVAMIIAPSWRSFDIKNLNPNLRFHIEPVPQLPGNTITWASYWVEGVSSKSKNQKQAMTFLQYLTSKEAAVKMYSEAAKQRLFGEPYALVELGSSVSTDPFVGAYIKQAQNARSFPLASLTHDNGINDRMVKYMEDAINSVDQNISPSEALNTMSQGFQQVFSSYGLSVNTAAQ